MEKLIKKLIINTELEVLTGLHIGGSGDNVEIGGIDNPVIKVGTKNGQPYIPGSSLKGKIRSLLEQIRGASQVGGSSEVNKVFGYSKESLISKLIVRDGYLKNHNKADDPENWAEKLENNEFLDMPYTEAKWENVIHRIKGTADHPRQMERVPAGVKFDVEFVINVWDNDEDGKKSVKLLKEGLKALELDYLGGSGTRGYGKVAFNWEKINNYTEIDLTKLLEDA